MTEWAVDTAAVVLVHIRVGTPHTSTIRRALSRMDARALHQSLRRWGQAATAPQVIAVDGKQVRGAKSGGGAPCLC